MPKLFSILPEVHPVNPWPSPSVWTSGHPRQTPSSRSCDRDLWKSGKAGDPLVRKIQRSDPVSAIEDPDSSGSFWTCLANCNFGDLNESVLLLIYTPGMFYLIVYNILVIFAFTFDEESYYSVAACLHMERDTLRCPCPSRPLLKRELYIMQNITVFSVGECLHFDWKIFTFLFCDYIRLSESMTFGVS